MNEQQAFLWTNGKMTKPIPFLCCPVKGHVFVDLHIKDKLCCQESIFMHVASAEERAKTKENPIFYFQKCPLPLIRECTSAYGNVENQSLTERQKGELKKLLRS